MTDNNTNDTPNNIPQHVQSNMPADTLRDTNLKATIWKNEGEKGAYYNTTLAKTYQDQDGNYRDTNIFAQNDLLRISELARSAYNRVGELRRENNRQLPEQAPQQGAEKQQFMENRQAQSPQKTRQR
ncbi:MAG: hypothetical protein R3D71_08295 [Rickettsiales bacterium]